MAGRSEATSSVAIRTQPWRCRADAGERTSPPGRRDCRAARARHHRAGSGRCPHQTHSRSHSVGRHFLERLERDGIEIAGERLASLRAVVLRAAATGSLKRRSTRRHRFGPQDRILERTARVALESVGAHADQQFIEDDAERVNIGRGRNRTRRRSARGPRSRASAPGLRAA